MNWCGEVMAVGMVSFLCALCGPAAAQDPGARSAPPAPGSCGAALTWKEAMGRVGERVVVEGRVVHVKVRKDRSPHLLVFGPNWKESLSVAIFDKEKFGDVQAVYQGKKIRVGGKVATYRGAAQIRVTDPSQITILE